jgi:outer membrane protein
MNKSYHFSIFIALILSITGFQLKAQVVIAHVNSDSIIPNMASYQSARSEIMTYTNILQKQFEGKQAEMEMYYLEVTNKRKQGQLSPKLEKDAEVKLQEMEANLQKVGKEIEAQIYEKESSLMKPVYEEYNKAIKEVSKENGYTYILDVKLTLYNDGGIDATKKIAAKLNIK